MSGCVALTEAERQALLDATSEAVSRIELMEVLAYRKYTNTPFWSAYEKLRSDESPLDDRGLEQAEAVCHWARAEMTASYGRPSRGETQMLNEALEALRKARELA